MRWGTQKWLWLATLLIAVAAGFWLWRGRWGERSYPDRAPFSEATDSSTSARESYPDGATARPTTSLHTFAMLCQPGLLNSPAAIVPAAQHSQTNSRFAHRLSNTKESVGQLARKENAILLENALLDTEAPLNLEIPRALRAEGDPGS